MRIALVSIQGFRGENKVSKFDGEDYLRTSNGNVSKDSGGCWEDFCQVTFN